MLVVQENTHKCASGGLVVMTMTCAISAKWILLSKAASLIETRTGKGGIISFSTMR